MSLKLHKRGKIWHYSGTVAGRRLRGTTGTQDKAQAKRIASKAEEAAWNRDINGIGADLTMAQASIAYRSAGKPTRFLDRIEDYWRNTLVRKITSGQIRASAQQLYPGLKAATHNRQVIVPTQAIINHAADLGWCAPIKVKRFKVNAKSKEPADLEWVNAFSDQAIEDGLSHLAAAALFMFGTGARRGEACALLWQDVDLEARTAVVRDTKTQQTRVAHLPTEVVAALANIPSNRQPDAPVFNYASGESIGQVWGNVCERAEIEPLTPHCCRHGFATTLLHKGVDPKTVAYLGGWKDVATVMKFYAHAQKNPTLTDAIFDTTVTQGETQSTVSIENKRIKQA